MVSSIQSSYSTLFRFWSVDNSAILAVGLIGCGEVAMGGCLFAWNFSLTNSIALREADRRQ